MPKYVAAYYFFSLVLTTVLNFCFVYKKNQWIFYKKSFGQVIERRNKKNIRNQERSCKIYY